MKHIRIGVLPVFCLLLAVLMGCTAQRQAAPSGSGAPFQAPVRSVEILQVVGAPGQLRALVKGDLPDGCTSLGSPAVDVSGTLVVVILPAARAASPQNCASGAVPYERTIDLGSAFSAGNYSVQVNGVEATFTLEGGASQASAGSSATGSSSTAGNSGSNAAASAATLAMPSATVPPPAATLVIENATPTAQAPTSVAAAAAVAPAATAAPTATLAPTKSAPAEAPQPTATPVSPTATPAAPTPTQTAPTQAPTPAQPASGQAASGSQPAQTPCVNKAAFFGDLTVDDGTVFDPGQAFTKTWQVKNAGSCTWSGYLMVFKAGDALSAAQPAKLDKSVAPGDLASISIQMTAPQKPGNYYSDWLISGPDGALFGIGAAGDGRLWVKIGVRSPIPVTSGPACVYTTDSGYESQILQMVNDARAAQGLKPLALEDRLSAAARSHSQDMACNNFVEHYGSDGSTWYSRITAQGAKYRSASENIYAGDPAFGGTPQGAFTWWMNSQVHRDNILDPKSTKIGIGYVASPQSTYKGYYTLDFTQP